VSDRVLVHVAGGVLTATLNRADKRNAIDSAMIDALLATFERADLPGLGAELSEAIAHIQAGEFRPTPSDFVCPDCPVLGVVCAGPALREHHMESAAAFSAS